MKLSLPPIQRLESPPPTPRSFRLPLRPIIVLFSSLPFLPKQTTAFAHAMADTDLIAALPCPKLTIEASVRVPLEHHNRQHDHHDDGDNDDNVFQGFAKTPPLISVPAAPMRVEREALEKDVSQGSEKEGGLQLLDAASNPSHRQDTSLGPNHKEDEAVGIDILLPHMKLSSSREGGKEGEEAAKSSLLAPIDESGALLFNPDLLLADVRVSPTTMDKEGGGVTSLSEPSTFPLSDPMSAPIKEQVIQEEALEAPNKDFPEDDASGNFAALPAENADTEKEIEKKERGNPDALFLEVKVSKMQGIAPPAPVLSMPIRPLRTTTIKEKDVNDNFGNSVQAEFVFSVASPSAPDAVPLLLPSPPSPSCEMPPSPSPSKRIARAVFEECFGSLTVPVLSVTEKLALRELCGVDLRQGLCLDAFQSGVGPCSMTNHVLAKVLRLSDNRVGRYRQQAHESQEQENGKRHPMRGEEEEEEEKENAKSIVWAISSLAPSRFNSVSQGQVMDFEVAREKRANRLEKGVKRNDVEGPGGDDEEKGGGEVDDGGQEAVDESFGRGLVLSEGTTNSAMEVTQALSVSSPSLSSQLDNNIFFGGVGGCGEGERRWMSNLKQSQQADKFPVDNVMR